MTKDDLAVKLRDVQELGADLRSREQRIQQDIASAHQRLELLWGELASAPGARRAEIDDRSRRLESDIQMLEAIARHLAATRALLDHASKTFHKAHARAGQ